VGEPNNNDIFAFGGNVSYVPGGGPSANDNPFNVQAGSAGTTFVRAANTADPWTFFEETSAGFTLTGVNCTSNLESKVVIPGTVNIDTPVQVTLVPGDVVTCTFSNTRKLAGLTVQKITTAGTGTFDFTASSPSSTTTSASVTTDEAGTPKDVLSLTDATGSFTSTENLSAGADPNSWTLDSVTCNDQAISPTPAIGSPVATVIPPGATYNCVYVNTPNGKIVIHKKSIGGVGTFHFGIIPITGDTLRGAGGISTASATTQSDGVPVTATVESGSLTNLPFEKYAVVEFGSEPTSAGEWVLTAATCDAADTAPINAPTLTGAVFTLTDHQPTINCTFDNTLFKTSTLDVSKTITGDTKARTGPVTIVSTCNDGNADTLTGAVGHNGPFAGNTLVFNNFMFTTEQQSTLSCTVHETATGVEKGGTVSTSWSLWLNGVELKSDTSSTAVVPIDPNGAYQVKFVNHYAAALVSPSPSPSDGTGGTGGGSNGGDLPHTGGNPWSLALLLGGAAAIVSGAIIGRRRRVVP
jgi:LPXTG-motif cell wall-anchored protein